MKKRSKQKKKWLVPLIIIVVLLLAGLGYAGYYFYALTQLKIDDVAVDSISNFSLKGFSFTGHLDLYNPSLIAVKISRIEYGIVFEPTSQLLSEGVLQGRKLQSKKVTSIPFRKEINWAPALSLIIQLVGSQKPANIVFSGYVYVTEDIKLPFVYKVDVREYFEQFVEEKKDETVEKAVQTVGEKYGKIAESVARRIAGYFT